MKHLPLTAALLVVFAGCSTQDLTKVLEAAGQTTSGPAPLTNSEVINGLREALRTGTERTVQATSATDGFWNNARIRVPFPAEAMKVKTTLEGIGMKKPVEDFERTLNKAAEEATKEAVPVFVDAITSMSITDGFAILNGGEQAATNFLKEKTTATLITKFKPVVAKATQKVALANYWQPLASAYNSAGLVTGAKAVDPDLDQYVTQKAIDGLFVMLADEEKKIRKDPLARTTDLLRRVFGQQ